MADYHNRVRELMRVRNVSQAKLITSTGIPRATMTRLLAGETKFNIDQLELVASTLGLSIHDVVSPLKFDHFSLTGITKLDELIRRITALRCIPWESKAQGIFSETHQIDARCYSPLYSRWNDDPEKPCPKLVQIQKRSQPERCIRQNHSRADALREVMLHEHPKIEGLYGIAITDELRLNEMAAKEVGNIYIPLRATVTGVRRVSVTTQMFADLNNRINGTLTQDEYVLTSTIKSIRNGSDAIIRHKLWNPIPDIGNFDHKRDVFERYVELAIN